VSELSVAVVSAEKSIWQGTARSIIAKTHEGDIGILPGHEPVLALLVEAPLRIEQTDGTKTLVAVHGGFISVDSDRVNVIAETAELAHDIDVDRARVALERAKARAHEEEAESRAAKRAETRLNVAMGASR
jgi:F-type H+-transporting ATPase subunit epsilon